MCAREYAPFPIAYHVQATCLVSASREGGGP